MALFWMRHCEPKCGLSQERGSCVTAPRTRSVMWTREISSSTCTRAHVNDDPTTGSLSSVPAYSVVLIEEPQSDDGPCAVEGASRQGSGWCAVGPPRKSEPSSRSEGPALFQCELILAPTSVFQLPARIPQVFPIISDSQKSKLQLWFSFVFLLFLIHWSQDC